MTFREGDLLAGKYRIEEVLGRGGMGVVVAAYHLQLGQRVAMKFLLPEACLQPQAVGRFLREARAAVRIQSEHVARVLDVGELEPGSPYIVMEFLRGNDLGEVVRMNGPLPVTDAVDYLLQACEAIAEAHTLGIVHRDLKPANLFLTRRPDGSGFVKVIDFGISKASQDVTGLGESGSMTSTTAMLGSPRYMSPEQMRSTKNVDHRTDIWSLGVVLFEVLTARPVYLAETLPGLIAMIGADPPPPLRSVLPNAPAVLEQIIARCLEKNPSRRFAHIGELALALAPLGDSRARASAERTVGVLRAAGMLSAGVATMTAVAPSEPAAPAPPQPAPSVGTSAAWGGTGNKRARGKSTVALVATGAVVSAGLVGALVFRGGTRDPSVAAAPSAPLAPSSNVEAATGPIKPTASTAEALAPPPPTQAAPASIAPVQTPPDRRPTPASNPKPSGDGGVARAAPSGRPAASRAPAPADRGADPF